MRRERLRANSPKRLWCFLGQLRARIRRLTAHDIPSLGGRVPEEGYTGTTPDVSEDAQFQWYEPVWFIDTRAQFPEDRRRLGRWIGVAETVGSPLASYIMTETGKYLVRSSVSPLSEEDKRSPAVATKLQLLDIGIEAAIGDHRKEVADEDVFPLPPDDLEEEDEVADSTDGGMPEADEYTPDSFDQYLAADVLLDRAGELVRGRVVGRKRDADGNPIGIRNPNPMLDTREYDVEFPDGSIETYTANIIAEAMYSQVDDLGREFLLMEEIVDHRKDGHAVPIDDGFIETPSGTRRPKITTKGWFLLVKWKDGTTTWVPLKDLKESNPVQVAEYAVANKLVSEPAFAWWVRTVLRKRDRILSKVKSKYWRRTHKFGVKLPHSVAEAYAIDEQTGTDFWRKAIEKEMRNNMPAFEFRDDDKVPVGYNKIHGHMVFDIRFDLTRKARYVANGNETEDIPHEEVFSSVVSRDSVRIAFLLAALNDLDILAADVQNAYLNAPTREKNYIIAGPEFGSNKGRPVLIVRALYGMRTSGARWRDHMASTLREAGFESSKADPDVWMRPNTKPDGFQYYEYVLMYVDDTLAVSHDPKRIMDHLASKYTLKPGSVKEPDVYLGATVEKVDVPGEPGRYNWTLSAETYVKRAIADVETRLKEEKSEIELPSKAATPLSSGYRPELDMTPELSDSQASWYQGLIGVLRWMCELGRVDILLETAMMSRFTASPRQGHLVQVLHIFGFLKQNTKASLVFDDREPDYDPGIFVKADWGEYYVDAREAIPPNAPKPRGKPVRTTAWVDADHAGCRLTRRSQTGILLFVNSAPIIWFSKRQNTVESSTFGSEFVALRIAVDLIEALRYKLRMFGVPLEDPTDTFCDNEAVVTNSTAPESTLKKKHTSIAYHRVREAQAAGYMRVGKVDGKFNLADGLTKCMPSPRRKLMFGKFIRYE